MIKRPSAASLACRSLRALRDRMRSEAGVTLITAVLALSVLSSAGATVVFFSSSNARNSAFAADHQSAGNLAEAGMNFARSTLWQAPDPTNPNSVPNTTQTVDGVPVTYFGTYDASAKVWTLTGRVEIPNPTGAAPIVRTASSKVRIASEEQGSTNNAIWNYLYQDDPNFCAEIANNVDLNIPLYTKGHLCISNNARVTGSSVQVIGDVKIGNNGRIGSPSEPTSEVKILGRCKYGNGGSGQWKNPPVEPCDNVWTGVLTDTPDSLSKPPVDMNAWYAAAKPGPMNYCTHGSFPGGFDDLPGVMDESLPEVNLAPSTPYDCKYYEGGQLVGQLSWTPGQGALPGTLTIHGVIFFDGPVKLNNNAHVIYQGKGVIYATGQVTISNNAKLCGITGCTSSWNPNVDMLVFIAGTTSEEDGFVIRNNARFQGAAYVENDFREWNNATVYGPIIARRVRVRNNAVHELIPFGALLPGMPASSTSTTTLENVEGSFTSS